MQITFSDENGNNITKAEWIRKFVKLTKSQAKIVDAIAAGAEVVYTQQTNKAEMIFNGETTRVQASMIWKLKDMFVLEAKSEARVRGNENIYGKSHVYSNISYQLTREYMESLA